MQNSSPLTRNTKFLLNTGAEIPALGLGTFSDVHMQEAAVATALKAGFRMIDTARVYGVEKEVGRGIKRSAVSRGDIFLGTKLWCNHFHPDDVQNALDESLRDLDTSYVDLLLMHYPVTFKRGPEMFPRDANGTMLLGETTYLDTWKAMEQLLRTEKVRAIGVSNFSMAEIENLIQNSDTVPAVHQMEVHPYLQQTDFNQWHDSRGIHVVQFSPLGNISPFYSNTGWSKDIATMRSVAEDNTILEIGRKYGRSAVQIALAWGINSGRSVIPKSVAEKHIMQNLHSDFLLDDDDMKVLATLDKKARFNDPSYDYQYRLYRDLEGIDGTKPGRTN